MTMDKDGFIKAIAERWIDDQWQDIDGADFQDLCVKHGLLIERPATQQDCDSEGGQEYGVDLGDPFFVKSDELIALLDTID